MSGVEPNLRLDAPNPRPADIYEWEILIQAPFAFDFFKLLRSLFRLPPPRTGDGAPAGPGPGWRRGYFLHVLLYNAGRIALILFMIPFTMLAFSYVATLPFLLMRAVEAGIGARAGAAIAAVGLLISLVLPVWVVLQWFRPGWVRESYKKSKVELFNIIIYLGLFLAAGMLETLIASPALPLQGDFSGPTDSTPQWTLYFADLSMNVLFAHIPQRMFGSISDIKLDPPGRTSISLGLLRLLLIVGFVTLVRMLVLKLCTNKTELFFGTRAQVKAYLPYCGRAMARPIRKVIPLPLEAEEAAIRESFRYRAENGDEPVATLPRIDNGAPPAVAEDGREPADRIASPIDVNTPNGADTHRDSEGE
jgi:hypothetical protein